MLTISPAARCLSAPQLPYGLSTVIFVEVLAVAWAESARQQQKDAEKVRAARDSAPEPAPLATLAP